MTVDPKMGNPFLYPKVMLAVLTLQKVEILIKENKVITVLHYLSVGQHNSCGFLIPLVIRSEDFQYRHLRRLKSQVPPRQL